MSRAKSLLASLLPLCAACSQLPLDPGAESRDQTFLGQWREVLVAPVTPGELSELRIGGEEYEGNFANRGDIIVEFADTDSITVELRPFSRAVHRDLAEDDFDRVSLWAYVAPGVAPQRPSEMTLPKPCVADSGVLRDGCALRTFYEGTVQPVRVGADMRVTLPRGFSGALGLTTEDNDFDEDYPARGDVCVAAGARAVEARLGKGTAVLNLDPGAAGGAVEANVIAEAAEITVDVAAGTASAVTASYTWDRDNDAVCDAAFDLDAFEQVGGAPGTDGNVIEGRAGPAGIPAATAYVRNKACQRVPTVETPEEAAALEGGAPPASIRGNVFFCNDCLGQASCEDLLPGY